jgi:hypothetical protein
LPGQPLLYVPILPVSCPYPKYASAPNIDEFGNKRADLEVEMEKEWLKIGHSGAAPSG